MAYLGKDMELHTRVTQHIVDVAVAIMRADFGSVQRYDREHKALKLLNHHGFSATSVASWQWVFPNSVTGCSQSMRIGRRVIVEDVETCDFLVTEREVYRSCGIRSMQSTPLTGDDGELIGMVSTHWRTPHQPSNTDLDLFDVWAHQAADIFSLNHELTTLLREAHHEIVRCHELVRKLQALIDKPPRMH